MCGNYVSLNYFCPPLDVSSNSSMLLRQGPHLGALSLQFFVALISIDDVILMFPSIVVSDLIDYTLSRLLTPVKI